MAITVAYFLIPALLFAIWIGQLVTLRRSRRHAERQAEFMLQQSRALNWLVDEAKHELQSAKVEAEAAKQAVLEKGAETQTVVRQEVRDLKQTIADTRTPAEGGGP